MKFDWQTDEDGPLVSEPLESKPGVTPGHRWLIWSAIPLVIILSGTLVYYQLNRRVDEAHLQVEADVLASFNLVQQALTQGDAELLATVLSRQDPQWFREWQEVAEEGSYPHAISPLLIGYGDSEMVSVTLSNELDQAEIVWQRPYTFRADNGQTQTIHLERTDFFYKTISGWLWTRPPDDFWGGWETWNGRYLILIYPARDEATAVPLAEALEAQLDSWCQGELPTFMRCPYQPPWEMRLAVNPATLNRLRNFEISRPASGGNWRFSPLPAPSLLGRPVDDAGQEALLRYYALQAGLILVRHDQQRPAQNLSPNSRMQGVLWLAEAGLYPWPPPDLPTAPTALPGDLVLHCANATESGLWHYDAATGDWRPLLPDMTVYEFAAWPGGDGFLVGSRVMHKEETWVELNRYRDGRLIPIRSFLDVNLEGLAASLSQHSSDGRYLTLYTHEQPHRWQQYQLDSEQCDENGCPLTPLDNETWWEIGSPDGRHALHLIAGQNGATIWLVDSDRQLLRRIGQGYNAIWLDDEQFVYVEMSFNPTSGPAPEVNYQLNLQRLDGVEPDLSKTAEELFAAHMSGEDAAWYSFGGLLPNPHWPGEIIILASRHSLNGSPNIMYPGMPSLFLLKLDKTSPNSAETRLLPTTITELIAGPAFSNNGRHLVLAGYEGARIIIELLDLENAASRRVIISDQPNFFEGLFTLFGFIQPGWSPDGRWLAMVYEGVVHLVNVDTAVHAALIPPQPGCANLAWLKTSIQ